jgi:hypothetical protein
MTLCWPCGLVVLPCRQSVNVALHFAPLVDTTKGDETQLHRPQKMHCTAATHISTLSSRHSLHKLTSTRPTGTVSIGEAGHSELGRPEKAVTALHGAVPLA